MADTGSKEGTIWPMPKFYFEVDFGTEFKAVAFQEVTGLDAEVQAIEYRKSNSPLFATEKMPGIAKHGNVTMKRGVFVNGDKFRDWLSEINTNTIRRRTVLIKLLDENGVPTMQWELGNAWPTKIRTTDSTSGGNEVVVDTLEIAYERLVISNGSRMGG